MSISEVEGIFEQLPTNMLYVVLVMKRAAARHGVWVHTGVLRVRGATSRQDTTCIQETTFTIHGDIKLKKRGMKPNNVRFCK